MHDKKCIERILLVEMHTAPALLYNLYFGSGSGSGKTEAGPSGSGSGPGKIGAVTSSTNEVICILQILIKEGKAIPQKDEMTNF